MSFQPMPEWFVQRQSDRLSNKCLTDGQIDRTDRHTETDTETDTDTDTDTETDRQTVRQTDR